ncbi:MAG TPA: DedA family protein [Thermoanaerobaculia bacterium]|jgi:membrane-associated protein|nr:DedA family protein [Thermoanaerobaculia bacterium]
MDLLKQLLEFFLHLDRHLADVIRDYGTWTYLILFLIVFCETGLVVTPFLPGDSLLFAAGTFAALGSLSPWVLFVVLTVAAVLGDTVNYWIGKKIGPRAFSGTVRFLKQEHLRKTEAFYERHGRKTIILARFVPIVRTFAPFVAGVGSMHYPVFLAYNVIGGVAWVALCVFAGYFFGNIPVVKRNFSIVIIAIIVISTLPILREAWRSWRAGRRAASA